MLISCLRNGERKETSTEQDPNIGKGNQKALSPQKKSLSFASSASSRSNSVSILKNSFENDFVIHQGRIQILKYLSKVFYSNLMALGSTDSNHQDAIIITCFIQ